MTRERAKMLGLILKAWADGETIQVRLKGSSMWSDYAGDYPAFYNDNWEWRVKPDTRSVRTFRSLEGFEDGSDRVEVYENGTGAVISKTGRVTALSKSLVDLLDPDRYVANGHWYEVKDDPATVPPFKFDLQRAADVVTRVWMKHTEDTVMAALRHRFGEVPDIDTLRKHLHRVIDHNRVEHWLWLDGPLKIGDKAPLHKAICRISPPSFGPYGNQES